MKWILLLFCALLFLYGSGYGMMWAYQTVTTGSFFEIRRIDISGTTFVNQEDIRNASGLKLGMNSLKCSISHIEAQIRKNPWIKNVSVIRRLPDAFEIRVREYVPAFWIIHEDRICYADAFGRIIAPVTPDSFISLPSLELLPGGREILPDLDRVLKMMKGLQLPVSMSEISLFRLSAAKGIELFLADRNLTLCIAEDDWNGNLTRMTVVMRDLARRGELNHTREIHADRSSVWASLSQPDQRERQ
ncbi:MAG: FtsQ-type POTRA domain-containing protein [Desulfovibrionaceae bacterium]|nr:FtsQ-type POTRA domain-containing protein [Desulfovibrionaceae bacterium]